MEKYKDIYDQLIKNSKPNGECLESTFKKDDPTKCPMFTHKKKMYSVHRASWEYHHGKIPPGMFVCHKCDNPKCFRIEHLFLGTPSDNMQDMIRKGRDNIFGAKKYTTRQLEKAENLRKEGYTYEEIAKTLKVNVNGIRSHLIRNKIIKEVSRPKDWKKYPSSIIKTINSLKEKGWTNTDIHRHLGISPSTLYRRVKEQINIS